MSEADSAICKTKRKGEWSSIPYDLLSNIANRLELIDFTSFHHVCKDWRSATEPLLEAKFCGCDPWFLFYGEQGPRCSILNPNDKVYTIEIPELDGSTCLASYHGWLLVFRNDSLFFFCPFSRAKIQLPNCPLTDSKQRYIAAFSSVPTSQDCIVAVISHASHFKLELNTLCRGDGIWFKHQFYHHEYEVTPLKWCAWFIEEKLIYANNRFVVIFDVATKQWSECSLQDIKDQPNDGSVLKFRLRDILPKAKKEKHRLMDLKGKLGVCDNVTIATCGTLYDAKNLVRGEYIRSVSVFEHRFLEGVWIVPRYHKH